MIQETFEGTVVKATGSWYDVRDEGSGEILHLYRDDMVRRLRFGFGGEKPDPMTYYIIATEGL